MQLFSRTELRDIALAVLGLIVILAIHPLPAFGINFSIIPTYFIGIVLGFIFHELAHKFVAKKFGVEAFFKLWPQGLGIGLLFAFLSPLKFLAPGAVVVYAHKFKRWHYRLDRVYTSPHGSGVSEAEMGWITTAGPLVNITFATLFSVFPDAISQQIAFINAWLAFFNLLPIPPLDGSKIFLWRGWLWLFLTIVAVALMIPYFID